MSETKVKNCGSSLLFPVDPNERVRCVDCGWSGPKGVYFGMCEDCYSVNLEKVSLKKEGTVPMGLFEREGEAAQDELAEGQGQDGSEATFCKKCGWHSEPGKPEYDFCPNCGSENLMSYKPIKMDTIKGPIPVEKPKPDTNTKPNDGVARGPDMFREHPMRGFVDISLVEKTFDQLSDSLADLAHRMMEQETTLKGLIGALDQQNAIMTHQTDALWGLLSLLKPRDVTPSSVKIPRFNLIADREPTALERSCFLAGVGFVLGHEDTRIDPEKSETVLSDLGVPMVRCIHCEGFVPAERAIRHNGDWYGFDCCYAEVEERIKNASKKK